MGRGGRGIIIGETISCTRTIQNQNEALTFLHQPLKWQERQVFAEYRFVTEVSVLAAVLPHSPLCVEDEVKFHLTAPNLA